MTEEERKAKRAAYMREYNKRPEANRKMRERSKSYYERKKEAVLTQQAEYRRAHPEVGQAAQARYRANPDNTIKLRYLQARYGISVEQYEAMVKAQSNLCAICQLPPRGRWGRLHVDHDHKTGAVRALLCFRCNAMLGNAQDDPAVLDRASAYLKSFA